MFRQWSAVVSILWKEFLVAHQRGLPLHKSLPRTHPWWSWTRPSRTPNISSPSKPRQKTPATKPTCWHPGGLSSATETSLIRVTATSAAAKKDAKLGTPSTSSTITSSTHLFYLQSWVSWRAKRVVCHCKPGKRCHGDTLITALRSRYPAAFVVGVTKEPPPDIVAATAAKAREEVVFEHILRRRLEWRWTAIGCRSFKEAPRTSRRHRLMLTWSLVDVTACMPTLYCLDGDGSCHLGICSGSRHRGIFKRFAEGKVRSFPFTTRSIDELSTEVSAILAGSGCGHTESR